MDYQRLCEKRDRLQKACARIPEDIMSTFEKSFEVEYAHNSTAIEGNTLTLVQTKVILEDGLSVGGKTLREIYEVANHARAFGYVKSCVAAGSPLGEDIVKEIHARLMENIQTGASHKPPYPSEMYRQIKEFFALLAQKTERNRIELAAWTHGEFVRLHPFSDGNGCTSRMLMNYRLIAGGFLPVSIAKENRLEYFEVLDAYGASGDLEPFAEMLAGLEEQRLDEYLSITCGMA